MVVLSAAILSKKKTLLARQFVEMSRLRVDGLLSAFPKLVDSEKGKDHTYIETESVRYVYQPMESLYLVLITNKSSNILEDLETLRLLAKTVLEQCKQTQVCEESILDNAFDIIFGFDEAISFGYRESVTLSQIKTFLEMESSDEKLHMRIEQSKINDAKEAAKKKAKELDASRLQAMRQGSSGGSSNPGSQSDNMNNGPQVYTDAGPSTNQGGVNMSSQPQQPVAPVDYGNAYSAHMPSRGMMLGKKKIMQQQQQQANQQNSMGGPGSGGAMNMGQNQVPTSVAGQMPMQQMGMPGQNMQNPMQMQQQNMNQSMQVQNGAPPGPVQNGPGPSPMELDGQKQQQINPLADPVTVLIEETCQASLGSEGGLNEPATVQGKFEITVYDDSKADLACFRLAPGVDNNKFKIKLHPNMNKQSHSEQNILEIRDPSKKFRANFPASLIKWQCKIEEEESIPLQVTCWPTPESGGLSMIIQYELSNDNVKLENITMRIPCPRGASGQLRNIENGEANFVGDILQWQIPVIDKNNSGGTLEFQAAADAAQLLPVTCQAFSSETVIPLSVTECFHQAQKVPVKYGQRKVCEYQLTIG